MDSLSGIIGSLVFWGLVLLGLWWIWQGVVGVWSLINYLAWRGFWQNTCLIVVVGMLFGWNLVLGITLLLVALGPITKYLVLKLWMKALT